MFFRLCGRTEKGWRSPAFLITFFAVECSDAALFFQSEINAGKWRKLDGKTPLTVLPRNVLRPDFA